MEIPPTEILDRIFIRILARDWALGGIIPTPLLLGVAFVVNAEPHIGGRPSVRVCMGLMTNVLAIRLFQLDQKINK